MSRRALDFYETPPHYVRALLTRIPAITSARVAEPCVGEGAISRFLSKPHTNDIDTARHATTHLDATTLDYWAVLKRLQLDWIVTNPPFNLAYQILDRALSQTRLPIALCLRLSFLEPTEERQWLLNAFPPSGQIILPRYSFRLNDHGKRQTDSVTCAWMIWNYDLMPPIQIEPRLVEV